MLQDERAKRHDVRNQGQTPKDERHTGVVQTSACTRHVIKHVESLGENRHDSSKKNQTQRCGSDVTYKSNCVDAGRSEVDDLRG